MKANLRAIQERFDDEGVSPVIAVILMVAITVVLAATVYVWVSGFSDDSSGPENAQIRMAGFDQDGDGATDWLRLTLVRGENAPYGESVVALTLIPPDAAPIDANDTNRYLCDDPSVAPTVAGTAPDLTSICAATESFFTAGGANTWDVGTSLYVPCQDVTNGKAHQLSVSLRSSVILDQKINCDEIAQ